MKCTRENAMLIDVQYIRPGYDENHNKLDDMLYYIYKNLDTNEKYIEIVPAPEIDIYFEKDEYRNHRHNLVYRELDKLNPVHCKYRDITSTICNDIGPSAKEFVSNCIKTKNYNEIRKLNLYPYVFGHDYDIRPLMRYEWYKKYDNDREKVFTKGFMDIEADSIDIDGFPDAKHCPIDLVTVMDDYNKVSYTFALIGREYVERKYDDYFGDDVEILKAKEEQRRKYYESRHRQEEELVNDVDGLKKELHEMFDESYGEIDYEFYFYHDELTMLIHLFQLINTLKLDFMYIWNISFDIPYIIERLKYYGVDPEKVMCHPDFPRKECYFKKDRVNFMVKNKSDYFHVSSYTVFQDQMILYAAIRKSQSELRSNKLNYIAKHVIGDSKLNYDEEGEFKTFGYKNYRKYFIYNIKDVLLQKGIENKVKDTETLYIKSYQNITPYENVFKQTVVLRNVQYKFYLDKKGLVPGGNVNIFTPPKDDDDEVGYEGALVGNPLLINNFGMNLFNKKTNYIFAYSIDMDMSAFYPSTIRVLNIDASTLIFKVIINASQFDVRGGDIPYHGITDVQLVSKNDDSFQDDVAKEIMDNFQTGNYLSLGYKIFNLPSVSEVYHEIMKGENNG